MTGSLNSVNCNGVKSDVIFDVSFEVIQLLLLSVLFVKRVGQRVDLFFNTNIVYTNLSVQIHFSLLSLILTHTLVTSS